MAAATLFVLMVPIGTNLPTTGIGTTNYKLTLLPAFPRLFARDRCNTTFPAPNALVPFSSTIDAIACFFFFPVSGFVFIIHWHWRMFSRNGEGRGDGEGEWGGRGRGSFK